MRLAALSAVPFVLALILVGTATAMAAQDTPFTANGVTAVCTGVGSAKDNPAWRDYPVKLVLANQDGENVAAAHIRVAQGGKTLLETDCDAPWVLVRAPAGDYTATASLNGGNGMSRSTNFSTGGSGGQKELTLMFRQASAQ